MAHQIENIIILTFILTFILNFLFGFLIFANLLKERIVSKRNSFFCAMVLEEPGVADNSNGDWDVYLIQPSPFQDLVLVTIYFLY